jgi:hypothetical protein
MNKIILERPCLQKGDGKELFLQSLSSNYHGSIKGFFGIPECHSKHINGVHSESLLTRDLWPFIPDTDRFSTDRFSIHLLFIHQCENRVFNGEGHFSEHFTVPRDKKEI